MSFIGKNILQVKFYLIIFYSDLCLMYLTIKNGSPKPLLKYNASITVNLYLLYTLKGKLVPGPPYAWLFLTAVVEKFLINWSPLEANIFLSISVIGRNWFKCTGTKTNSELQFAVCNKKLASSKKINSFLQLGSQWCQCSINPFELCRKSFQ